MTSRQDFVAEKLKIEKLFSLNAKLIFSPNQKIQISADAAFLLHFKVFFRKMEINFA